MIVVETGDGRGGAEEQSGRGIWPGGNRDVGTGVGQKTAVNSADSGR